jgi:pimeloyl-ACP methyl ester carboxylesterase
VWENPPVLLVHGLGTSCARTWGDNGWIDLLADAGREVIGVDLLGHGDAPKPHDPSAYDRLEHDVAGRLPEGEPVDAIGFSLGGRVVLTLAAEQPSRFRRIVVAGVGANLFRDDGSGAVIAKAIAGTGGDDGSNPVATCAGRAAPAAAPAVDARGPRGRRRPRARRPR